jgi:hypothetical protein
LYVPEGTCPAKALKPKLNRKPLGLYKSFHRYLSNTPVKDVALRFSEYADRIMTESYTTGASPHGEFLVAMKDTPIFKEYLEWWRTGDPELLRYILTFLRFLKKMKYVDPGFNSTAFREWKLNEERLNGLDLANSEHLSPLKRLVRYLLPDPDTNMLLGRFGPGAVSEPGVRGNIRKASELGFDQKLRRALIHNSLLRSHDAGLSVLESYGPIGALIGREGGGEHAVDYSTLRFVPKDLRKSRSICMEPNNYMFAQQLVLSWMLDAMESGPSRLYIDLRDQTRNQEGAMFGSATGMVDTIDLSSASDLVHSDLVRAVFPRKWLILLLGTRTSKVLLPDGEIAHVKKFAPMGSALCFPVQCILFLAVILYQYLNHLRIEESWTDFWMALPDMTDSEISHLLSRYIWSSWSYDHGSQKLHPPSVYGDDLITDTRVTNEIMGVLSSLGFKVNSEKSFTGSQAVRESCGRFYYEGYDITPVTYTAVFDEKGISPARYASLVGLANNAYSYWYVNLRTSILASLKGSDWHFDGIRNGRRFAPQDHIRFTRDPNEFGILTYSQIQCPEARYNPSLQRAEWLTVGVDIKRRVHPRTSSELDSYERYALYIDSQARYREAEDLMPHLRYRPEDTRFVVRWTPLR